MEALTRVRVSSFAVLFLALCSWVLSLGEETGCAYRPVCMCVLLDGNSAAALARFCLLLLSTEHASISHTNRRPGLDQRCGVRHGYERPNSRGQVLSSVELVSPLEHERDCICTSSGSIRC
jgi:hypothetical protein